MLQPSDNLHGSSLDLLQQFHTFCFGAPRSGCSILNLRPQKCRVDGDKHLPHPPGHLSFDGAQNTVGLLSCECMLLANVMIFIHEALFHRAPLSELFSQSIHLSGIAIAQVQDLALGLVEPH